jgi:hypothetical protein
MKIPITNGLNLPINIVIEGGTNEVIYIECGIYYCTTLNYTPQKSLTTLTFNFLLSLAMRKIRLVLSKNYSVNY